MTGRFFVMHLDDARRAVDCVIEASEASADSRARAVQRVLAEHGASALGISPAPLHDIIRSATNAVQSPARRDFALLLVHALKAKDAVRPRARPALFDRDVCALVESALLNPLRRAAYPFAASTYDKIRFLAGLHATIDDHVKPLEPTFPPWLSGLPNTRRN